MGLSDRFPWYALAALLALTAVAAGAFFLPPALGSSLGLSVGQFILVVAAIELAAAVGIAAIVIHYRDDDEGAGDGEWRFDP